MADMVVWRSLQISIAWDFWCNLRGPHILSCHEAKAAVNVDVLPFSLGKICEAPIGWGLLWWSSWATPGGARATTCYRPIVVAAGGPFVWIFLGFSTIRVPTNPIWRINISHTFPIKLASFGVSRYQQVSDTPIWQYDHIAYIYAYIYSLCRKETAWSRYSYNFATNVCTNSQTAHLVNPAKGVAALHFALNGAWYIHIYIIWLQLSYLKC